MPNERAHPPPPPRPTPASYDAAAAPVGPAGLVAPRPPRRRRRARRVLAGVLAVWLLGAVVQGSPVWLLELPSQAMGSFEADHAFLHTTGGGQPIAWDHCRAIHYVVNPQGAPSDWRALVRSALDEITAASGWVFVLDGTTTDRDFQGGRYERDPVLVGWGVRREVGPIGDGAAGLASPITYPGGRGPHYGSGFVLLDSLYFDGLRRSGREGEEQMIVAHEFMHVLGLGHVERADEVMGTSGRRRGGTHLGDGDIAGLRALRAVPCAGTATP